MTKQKKLSAIFVEKIAKKGRYADGNGLYLQVAGGGSKSWIYRYTLNGKTTEMGLGSYLPATKKERKLDKEFPLTEARDKAEEYRRLLKQGIDPLRAKQQQAQKERLSSVEALTFKDCALRYIETHYQSWKNAKHRQQWENTLKTYAYPTLGGLAVQDVDVGLVMRVLSPIWHKKTETASRLRGRIEMVLDWATAHGYRKGENPARWKGHLENLLPHRNKQQKVKHHPALTYAKVNEFIQDLDGQIGEAVQALKLVIFTASRTSEVIAARWEEFNLKEKVWTIPEGRIKGGREQRIPLSAPAMEILQALYKQKNSSFIFAGRNKDKHMSNNALLMLRRRMGYADKDANKHITIHGFRSTFRDWAAEQTAYPREVVENALAHVNKDKTEAAYFRSDLFEKRRQLMDAWARYCLTKQEKEDQLGKVVKLRKRAK